MVEDFLSVIDFEDSMFYILRKEFCFFTISKDAAEYFLYPFGRDGD